MGDLSATALLGLLSFSIIASFTVLWVAGVVMGRRTPATIPHPAVAETENAFLFHDGMLADHDSTQPEVFSGIENWRDLRDWLGTRFGELPAELPADNQADLAFPSVSGAKDPAKIRIKSMDGVARVTLKDQIAAQPIDRHQVMRLQRALYEGQAALQTRCARFTQFIAGRCAEHHSSARQFPHIKRLVYQDGLRTNRKTG